MIVRERPAAPSVELPLAAEENLAALRSESRIVAGCVLSADGEPFACYHRDGTLFTPPARFTEPHLFTDTRLQLFRDIVYQDDHFGSIYLESDLRELEEGA